MFKAKIKSEILKEVVEVLATLVDEAKFNIDKTGINVKAVDPSHVAMVDLMLEKKAFEEYKATKCELGIDLDKVSDTMRLAHAGDVILLEHDEDNNRFVMTVENITRRMALVDTAGMSDPKVPNLDLPTKLSLKTDEISRGIKAAESISDHIALVCTADYFEMKTEGDTDSVNLKLPKDLLEAMECKDSTRSLFPLDYLSKMVKAIQSANSMTMSLGTDYPVKIEFQIANTAGNVRYLLAPRIESE